MSASLIDNIAHYEYEEFFYELFDSKRNFDEVDLDKCIEYNEDSIEFSRILMDQLKEGIIIIHKKKIAMINRSACNILGYSKEELINLSTTKLHEFVQSDSHPLLYKLTYNYIKGNFKQLPCEIEVIRKDGHSVWLEPTVTLVKYYGKPSVQISFVDISRIRESTSALLREHEKQRALFKSIPAFVFFKDKDFNYLSVNKSYADMVGKTVGEIRGMNDYDLYSKEMADNIREIDTEVIKECKTIIREFVWFKHEKKRWFLTQKSPYMDSNNNVIGLVGTSIDISLFKKSEKERKIFFELSPALVCTFDLKGNIRESNKKWQTILGWSIEELGMKNFFELVHPNDLKQTKSAIDKVLKGKELINFDNRFLTKHGEYKWLSWNTRFFKYKNLIYGVAYDLSKRVRLEESLIHAIRNTEKANKTKSTFLANMSHELRTPLNSILGFSQLLNMEGNDNFTDEQKSYLGYIYNNGQHLLDMVNDILDLSKIESGKIDLNKEKIDIKDTVNRVIYTLNSLILEKDLTVSVNISNDIDYINADMIRVKQIIFNLLSNAIKFTGEHKNIGIDVTRDHKNEETHISIWDEGIGIPEDQIVNIFNPFEQIDSDSRSGTGLGLAITKKLIELHSAKLKVKSKPGKGSRFTVIFKDHVDDEEKNLLKNGKEKENSGNSSPSSEYGNSRVLIVDDNLSNIDFLKSALKLFKVNFDTATSGKIAIEKVKNNSYALILMDIQMPDMNGIEACKKIKGMIEEMPVVATTAYAMKGDKEKFLNHGFDDYLPKPIDLSFLKDIIQRFCTEDRKNLSE